MIFDKFIELLSEYTEDFSAWGAIRLAVDIIIVIAFLVAAYKLLRIRLHRNRTIIFIIVALVFYAIIYTMQLSITLKLLNFIVFWSFGILIIIYNQEIKHFIDNLIHSTRNEISYTSEEERHKVIETLVKTSSYLSKRKIGALMTIERMDNLNQLIDKAIYMKAYISEELLTTIFTVGTATHDGAVIIRRNRIMCAAAYLPTTDKYDIPKTLGTRHRAAIGLSERYDAITIVVSEETGNISVAADGVIDLNLTEDRLRETLEHYIYTK